MKSTLIKAETTLLSVSKVFLSIQGEGYHSGKPAWFIRLEGCDIGCHWCDTKYTWKINKHKNKTVQEIINDKIIYSDVKNVIVTGGEPCMHELSVLTEELHKNGKKTFLETSGAYKISGQWDWITCSPKKFKTPSIATISHVHELKIVVYHDSDILWAKQFVKHVNRNCILSLQPEWSRKDIILPHILRFISTNPQWRLSVQTHKYLDIE